MKNILFLLVIVSTVILYSCDKNTDDFDSSLLYGSWKWSCENGESDVITYRHPDDPNISLCRGIVSYDFKEDGRFINNTFFCTIAETLEGNWTFDGEKITLDFDKKDMLIYEVNRLDDKILEIKK